MKIYSMLWACLLMAAPDAHPQVNAEEEVPVQVQMKVYRVYGDISGDTSLTENLWHGLDRDKIAARQGPYIFFTLAQLTLADVHLDANSQGWSWDGESEPPSGKRVELIAAPTVLVNDGQPFSVEVASEKPIEYFEKRPDGLFEWKQLLATTGYSVSATVERGKGGRLLLRDFLRKATTIEKRKKLEGVSLDVGEPILRTDEDEITIAVQPNRYYGIEVLTEGYGLLLVQLRLTLHEPAVANEPHAEGPH